MIFKKILGKTIETAKKSAHQMYGDDFLILESTPPDGKNQAGVKIAVDKDQRKKSGSQNNPAGDSNNGRENPGIKFERTNGSYGTGNSSEPASPNLLALRKYVENRDFSSKENGTDKSQKKTLTDGPRFTPDSEPEHEKIKKSPGNLYSRANIRAQQQAGSGVNGTAVNSYETKGDGSKTESQLPGTHLLERFDQTGPKISGAAPGSAVTERKEKREIAALHKRFDKLEALLDSALITSTLDYVSHPAFQQLVHTGISTSVVAGWFSEIIKDGIDPYDHTEKFMSGLSAIIRDALSWTESGETRKYMMFTGPSGSGKTHLVMKLALHPDYLLNKKIAVVSLMPQSEPGHQYYTILEPFCNDHDIPFFKVKSGAEVTTLQNRWEEFDHVLIDTPSISIQQDNSFRQYWKIRQVFVSLAPMEVHYVVNASLNRFYFRDSSATHHPLQPDYVAITHLDEVSQWGPVIPFLKEMGCGAKYICTGDSIPGSLSEFNPTRFAQKVLRDT